MVEFCVQFAFGVSNESNEGILAFQKIFSNHFSFVNHCKFHDPLFNCTGCPETLCPVCLDAVEALWIQLSRF